MQEGFQRQGLGTILFGKLIEIGRAEGLRRITGDTLFENLAMQRILKRIGFNLRHDVEVGVIKADLDLYQRV